MKWIYKIEPKFKTALALTIVVVLVLGTNMVNKSHFSRLQQSFASVYEDRLLVENYIYKLSHALNKKRLALYDSPLEGRIFTKAANDSIQNLVIAYQQTKLTKAEAKLFNRFIQDNALLQHHEKQYFKGNRQEVDSLGIILGQQHDKLADILNGLSDIQLEEGKNLITDSDTIIASNNLYAHLEIILIIIIGLIIQALLFASKSLKPKFDQDERMN
ncbi:MAG TPA: MCP four helix bundle domain-containing protein [Fulvivirga sp.]|nr:MCP four helix bundle domain-containing protein [Fulvivirga sp.]